MLHFFIITILFSVYSFFLSKQPQPDNPSCQKI